MLAAPVGHAQPATTDAFEQNRKLGRGVNILGYDPIWRSRDAGPVSSQALPLAERGRLQLRARQPAAVPADESANDYALSESWFEVLDWAVREAQAQDLRVILDLHEYTSLGDDPATNKVKFLAFWRQLSAHCQSAPESVLFEVLNEPNRAS